MITANDNGVLRSLGTVSENNGGVLHELNTVHANDGGVLREVYSAAKPLSSLNVGDIVKIKEDSVPTNFIIVHKGNPDPTLYDASCNGIWLLRERIHRKYGLGTNGWYDTTYIHSWLNNGYLNSLETNVIKTVKIPYLRLDNYSSTIQSGVNGLSCSVFLLSAYEVGLSTFGGNGADGSKLSYFSDDTSRIVKDNTGTAVVWWTRSGDDRTGVYCCVGKEGEAIHRVSGYVTTGIDYGIRPALILPDTVRVDSDGNIVV